MTNSTAEFIFFGKDEDIKSFVEDVKREWTEARATKIPDPGAEDDAFTPLGMEPLTYFAIAFGAHLTASLSHDAIKLAVKKLAAKLNVKIKQED